MCEWEGAPVAMGEREGAPVATRELLRGNPSSHGRARRSTNSHGRVRGNTSSHGKARRSTSNHGRVRGSTSSHACGVRGNTRTPVVLGHGDKWVVVIVRANGQGSVWALASLLECAANWIWKISSGKSQTMHGGSCRPGQASSAVSLCSARGHSQLVRLEKGILEHEQSTFQQQ